MGFVTRHAELPISNHNPITIATWMAAALLPSELISRVLEKNYYKPNGCCDYDTLLSCSAVCKAWCTPSQTLLFRKVKFAKKSCSPIERLIKDQGASLGYNIRSLEVFVGSSDGVLSVNDLTLIIKNCPRIFELIFRVRGLHQLSDYEINELRVASSHSTGSTIQALHLLDCGGLSKVLYQLLSLWSVQFLRVGTEIVTPPPKTPSMLNLYELTLYRPLPVETLEWLLASSKDSLNVFELRGPPPLEVIQYLTTFGPSFRSLRLTRYNCRSFPLVESCRNLEELVLFIIPSQLPLSFPSTLTHFNFMLLNGEIQPVLLAIASHPNLVKVTWSVLGQEGNNQYRDDADLTLLANTCDTFGVELNVEGKIWGVSESGCTWSES